MTQPSTLACLLVTLVATACTVSAKPGGQTPSPAPSAASVSDTARAAFSRYDVNRDDRLDSPEFVAGMWGDIRFVKAPTDDEVARFKAGFARQFDGLDTDRDQRLTLAEFAKAFQDLM